MQNTSLEMNFPYLAIVEYADFSNKNDTNKDATKLLNKA
jgi:hypothetical protein